MVVAAAGDTARMHTGNRLEGFKPYRPTSTLARMVHAARSAYAHISLTYIHSHTHTQPSVCRMFQAMCMAKMRCCCCCRLCHRPFPPVYPPSILFLSKFKFCFTAKKNYAHQTHCLCAKNPHRFFSNTPSRLCPVEMVLRSTMQYILYRTDFYIIVLD